MEVGNCVAKALENLPGNMPCSFECDAESVKVGGTHGSIIYYCWHLVAPGACLRRVPLCGGPSLDHLPPNPRCLNFLPTGGIALGRRRRFLLHLLARAKSGTRERGLPGP